MLSVGDVKLEYSPKVYILILNWNGWSDTLECLESVFRSNYTNYQVIVCDNDSQNNSIERIKAWADGTLNAYVHPANPLRHLSFPPIKKPIGYVEYNRTQAECGGQSCTTSTPLIIIKTGANLGFAGGNNVGLRYAMARNDFDYIWLLNVDTVIDMFALSELVKRMDERIDAGLCGSTLLFYDKPDTVQGLGGAKYNPIFATSRHLGLNQKANLSISQSAVEKELHYIIAASMLIRKSFIRSTGLMCEDYFLYFEEIDWAIRGRKLFSLAYSNHSIVYHKEGSCIGSSSDPLLKSDMSDYFNIRNRFLLTRKYYPIFIPAIYLSMLVVIINRLKRKKFNRIATVFRAVLNYKYYLSF